MMYILINKNIFANGMASSYNFEGSKHKKVIYI